MCDKTLSEVLTELDRNEPPISDQNPGPVMGKNTQFGRALKPESMRRRGLWRQNQRSEK